MTKAESLDEMVRLGNRITEIVHEMKQRAKALFPEAYAEENWDV